MSENLVSFTARRQGALTPYRLLKELAEIDAILIFSFADQIAHIGYNIPNERVPRDEYLCRLFNDAPEDFKQAYIAELWDLIGLPRNDCQMVNVAEIKIPLAPIFSEEFPNGAAAGACLNFVRESLDKIPRIVEFGSPQHIDRIVLDAIRDRIFRIDQDQDANWKAEFDCARAF